MDLITVDKMLIAEKLNSLGVEVSVEGAVVGPTLVRYELKLGHGVKVSEVKNLVDDLSMALGGRQVRVLTSIPGKSLMGLEVPRLCPQPVLFTAPDDNPADLRVRLGVAVDGANVFLDLDRTPHLLVAGTTGSGKSAFIHNLICSWLPSLTSGKILAYLVDPKLVELSVYSKIAGVRLISPGSVDSALQTLVVEMESRFAMLAKVGARNIDSYNATSELKLHRIVVIIDEYADLLSVEPQVETSLCRLAQKARAVGIHLILATQRPSADVLTGKIKANFSSRVAFRVPTSVDSKVILDQVGAECLAGCGDGLFLDASGHLVRFQGAYVADSILSSLLSKYELYDAFSFEVQGNKDRVVLADCDPLASEAMKLIDQLIVAGKTETSLLNFKRDLKVGELRARQILSWLQAGGFVKFDPK